MAHISKEVFFVVPNELDLFLEEGEGNKFKVTNELEQV